MTPERQSRILNKLAEIVGGGGQPHEGAGGNVVKSRGSLVNSRDRSVTSEQVKRLAKRGKVPAGAVARAGKMSVTDTPASRGMG